MGAFVAVDNFYLYSPWPRLQPVLDVVRRALEYGGVSKLVIFEELQLVVHRRGERVRSKLEVFTFRIQEPVLKRVFERALRQGRLVIDDVLRVGVSDELIPMLEYSLLANAETGSVENVPGDGTIRIDDVVKKRVRGLLRGVSLLSLFNFNPYSYSTYLVERVRRILSVQHKSIEPCLEQGGVNSIASEVEKRYCGRLGDSCPVIRRGDRLLSQHLDDVRLATEILGYHDRTKEAGMVLTLFRPYECFACTIEYVSEITNGRILKIPRKLGRSRSHK